MDRCRCEDYKAAVKKLKFFTVGTHRPDIIENHSRSGYVTAWIKNNVSYEDMKFLKPKAWKIQPPGEQHNKKLQNENEMIQNMWCPYMSPVKRETLT